MLKSLAITLLVLIGAYFWASRDGFDPGMVRGKRVLVTGSSSGIGEQLAYEYSKLGARLVLTARRLELLEKVAHQCRSLGATEVYVFTADMGIQEDRAKLVAATEKALGGLDHLILNHADLRMHRWKSTPEDLVSLSDMMNVNFISFVDLTSRFLPTLKKSEGHVAVVSSLAGKVGFVQMERYCASKHALHGFFASWRQDLRHQGVQVSFTMCVLGPIATETAKDIASDSIGFATIEDTAVAIIRATTTRAREMYFGWFSSVMAGIHKFFPAYLEDKMADYFIDFFKDMP